MGEPKTEVSNGYSRGGFGFGMRGTLDRVGKQIPIPKLKDVEFSQAVKELDRLLTEIPDTRDHDC